MKIFSSKTVKQFSAILESKTKQTVYWYLLDIQQHLELVNTDPAARTSVVCVFLNIFIQV